MSIRDEIRSAMGEVRELVGGLDVERLSAGTARNRLIEVELPNIPPVTLDGHDGGMASDWRLHGVVTNRVRELLAQELVDPAQDELPAIATMDQVDTSLRAFTWAVAALATEIAATAPADPRKAVSGTEWRKPRLVGWTSPQVNELAQAGRDALREYSRIFARFQISGGAA